MLKFHLLGRPQISLNDQPVTGFASEKELLLLCYLLLNPGEQSRPQLAGLLWGEMSEERARANLSTAVYNLRQLLPNAIEANRKTAAFNPDQPVWLDTAVLQQALDNAWEIGKLTEARRQIYEKLRLATAKPEFIQWRLPDSVGFRRPPTAPSFDKHLYLDEADAFRAELGGWEAGVLAEELADTAVVGWLRNVERQPWSLEIPYEDGGKVKAMFPDMVIVRQEGDDFRFDILEPHDSSRKDNAAKAVGLAKFVEDHPYSFDRVQLIRQRRGADGREHYYRLDMGKEPVRRQVLTVSDNNQLDQIFEREARTRA